MDLILCVTQTYLGKIRNLKVDGLGPCGPPGSTTYGCARDYEIAKPAHELR